MKVYNLNLTYLQLTKNMINLSYCSNEMNENDFSKRFKIRKGGETCK